jgi:hypothetical protein
MTDLPAPVVRPPELPPPRIAAEVLEDLASHSKVCANCHAQLTGEFCSACGQRHEPHIHTVAHFASEAFESISHADSRLWRTLWYLFARPGFLTSEFFAGRRVAYLPPFRLYLVLSVLFFVVIGIDARSDGERIASTGIEKGRSPADIAAMNELADQVANQKLAPMTDETRERIASQLRDIATEEAAKLAAEQAAVASAPAAAAAAGENLAARTGDIDVMTGEGVQDGIDEFCDGFRASTAPGDAPITAKQRSVLRWCRKYDEDGFRAVGETLARNIPKAMFIFLPLLALCMKLIYWRPKRYYVEHLLFMVHNHAFVFLVTTVVMLVAMIPYVGDYAWIPYWAAFIYIAWYIYRAMRNVYHQGRALTIIKYLTMGWVYIFAGAMIFLLTFIYSTIMF